MAAPAASSNRRESVKQMASITVQALNVNNDCAADIILRVLLTLLIVKEEPAKQRWITLHQYLHKSIINFPRNGLRLRLQNEGQVLSRCGAGELIQGRRYLGGGYGCSVPITEFCD